MLLSNLQKSFCFLNFCEDVSFASPHIVRQNVSLPIGDSAYTALPLYSCCQIAVRFPHTLGTPVGPLSNVEPCPHPLKNAPVASPYIPCRAFGVGFVLGLFHIFCRNSASMVLRHATKLFHFSRIYFEVPFIRINPNLSSEQFPSFTRRGARRAGWFMLYYLRN